jgi:hypothetical protein
MAGFRNGLARGPVGRDMPTAIVLSGHSDAVNGELADGTMPYLAGPRTIAEFIEPTIAKAAADAGRPAPRIIATMLKRDVEPSPRR